MYKYFALSGVQNGCISSNISRGAWKLTEQERESYFILALQASRIFLYSTGNKEKYGRLAEMALSDLPNT